MRIGDDIVEGRILMELDVPSLRLNQRQLNTQVLALQAKLEALQIRSVEEPASSVELQALTESLVERQNQKALLDARLEQLTLRAELDGKLIPAAARPVSMLTRSLQRDEIESERDYWLASRNQGASVPEGTLLGWVVDPKRLELRAFISDQDAERVLPEMQVECRWDAIPTKTIQGRVVRLSAEPIATTPEVLIGDSQLISIRNSNGEMTPERPHYEVIIALSTLPNTTIGDSTASVRIETTPETLFVRLERWFRNSLN